MLCGAVAALICPAHLALLTADAGLIVVAWRAGLLSTLVGGSITGRVLPAMRAVLILQTLLVLHAEGAVAGLVLLLVLVLLRAFLPFHNLAGEIRVPKGQAAQCFVGLGPWTQGLRAGDPWFRLSDSD